MKKKIIVIISIIVVVLVTAGIAVYAVTSDNFNFLEVPKTTETPTEPITEAPTDEPSEAPTEKPTEPTKPDEPIIQISKEGQRQLEKFEKYALHGVVFGMSDDDLQKTIGFRHSDSKFDYTMMCEYIKYENMYIRFDEDDGYFGNILVLEGEYLGLTIGKSTREDADRIFDFGSHERDAYGKARYTMERVPDDEERYYASDYRRDGVMIIVYYEYDIVVAIEALEIRAEWGERQYHE